MSSCIYWVFGEDDSAEIISLICSFHFLHNCLIMCGNEKEVVHMACTCVLM